MRAATKYSLTFLLASSLAVVSTVSAGDDFVNRVIVFGDSLSDGGYYSSLGPLPPSSSFTTNPDPVAPEVFASQLGLSLLPAYGQGGTNYATGDARVTAPRQLSIPIATQIDNFLAAGGRFNEDDVVYIQGGGNDFFAFLGGGGTDNAILTTAAEDLAVQVASIQAVGGPRIVTMAVQTGGFAGLELYNETYEAALAANGVNALYFDTAALFDELVASADAFGFTNVSDPACGAVSSLTCTPADWVAPDANETHILADGVHPAGKTQRIQGQAIASLLIAPEQIGQLSYAGQALFRGHRDQTRQAFRGGFNQEVGGSVLFGKLGAHDFQSDAQITGLEEDALVFTLGLDHHLADQTSVGVSFSVSDGDGEFDRGRGDYNVDAISALFYTQGNIGQFHIHSDIMLGRARYENLTREVRLGPVTREHVGDTDADFFGLGVTASRALAMGNALQITPRVGINYQTLSVDGYNEGTSVSTMTRFGNQELDSLNGLVGIRFSNDLAQTLHFYVDGQFNYEFDDDDRKFTIVPSGAPIAYTSELYQAEREYFSFDAGVDFRLTGNTVLQAGVSGTAGRDELERTIFFIGSRIEL